MIARYEAAPPNAKKTRTVASSLDELVKKESLAASRIKVDEVDCRGESCRVRVSFAEDAPASPIVMELRCSPIATRSKRPPPLGTTVAQ